MSSSQENMQYSEQLLTGVTGYVVDKRQRELTSMANRILTMTTGRSMGNRHWNDVADALYATAGCRVYPSAKGEKQVLKVSMQSNAPVRQTALLIQQ